MMLAPQQRWKQQQLPSKACRGLRNVVCVCLLLGPVLSSYQHVTCACLLLSLLLQCPTPPIDLYTAARLQNGGAAVQAKQLECQLPLLFVTPATAQGVQLASFQQSTPAASAVRASLTSTHVHTWQPDCTLRGWRILSWEPDTSSLCAPAAAAGGAAGPHHAASQHLLLRVPLTAAYRWRCMASMH
jgi:hypothetical protein